MLPQKLFSWSAIAVVLQMAIIKNGPVKLVSSKNSNCAITCRTIAPRDKKPDLYIIVEMEESGKIGLVLKSEGDKTSAMLSSFFFSRRNHLTMRLVDRHGNPYWFLWEKVRVCNVCKRNKKI